MKQGTYILTFSGPEESRWGQPHFESVIYENTTNGIRTLSILNDDTTIAGSNVFQVPKCDVVNSLIKYIPFWDPSGRKPQLIKTTLNCGQRYSGMYRPMYISDYRDMENLLLDGRITCDYYVDPPINDIKTYSNYLRQLEFILDELHTVFMVVEPDKNNFETFGNTIRNILILACTEFDSLMKLILKENNIENTNDRYSTKDYVSLLRPLKLREYSLSLKNINEINTISPFLKWNKNNPTKSLNWYDAYNGIKHDRINNFKQAKLSNALDAIMGFAATLIAKYGYRNDLWNEKIGKIIQVDKEPQWAVKDFYIPPFCHSNFQYVDYPLIVNQRS